MSACVRACVSIMREVTSTVVKAGEDGVAGFILGFLNRLSDVVRVQANLLTYTVTHSLPQSR